MASRFGTGVPVITIAIALVSTCPPAGADDWPCWRGKNFDGISRETGLLAEWPKDGLHQLWQVDLSGGFSSVVVAGGRVFTQTKETNQEIVLCLDAATGKDIWRYAYDCDYTAHPSFTGGGMPRSRTGPRSTPTVAGDRVYALGATGIFSCLEARTGKKIWQQDLLKIACRKCPTHGYSSCPLVVADRIYINPGGGAGKSIAALDAKDGAVLWQALDDPIGNATPIWIDAEGRSQVVFFTGAGAVGVNPQDGTLLWRYPWQTRYDLHIATPIFADGKVFISSNYGTGGAVFRLTGTAQPETLWKAKTMQNHFSSSVLYQGHLYGFSDQRLRCVEFDTGKEKWEKTGLGKGSLLVADGHLIILGDHGALVLAKLTPDTFSPISQCQVFDKATLTWTVPVVADGRLFIRHQNGLLALALRERKAGQQE